MLITERKNLSVFEQIWSPERIAERKRDRTREMWLAFWEIRMRIRTKRTITLECGATKHGQIYSTRIKSMSTPYGQNLKPKFKQNK